MNHLITGGVYVVAVVREEGWRTVDQSPMIRMLRWMNSFQDIRLTDDEQWKVAEAVGRLRRIVGRPISGQF